jgi:hypothetical protein
VGFGFVEFLFVGWFGCLCVLRSALRFFLIIFNYLKKKRIRRKEREREREREREIPNSESQDTPKLLGKFRMEITKASTWH